MDSNNPRFKRLRNQYVLVFILLIPILLISPNIFSQVTQEWVARYDGPGNNTDYAYAIAVDTSGNVYVTGNSYTFPYYYDYATIKYNSSGVQQWVRIYDGTGSSDDIANAIALDISGNVYVTGGSWGGLGTYDDYATIKYNNLGVQQWVSRYNGAGGQIFDDDCAYAIAVDSSGNVYVTGESSGLPADNDYATVKYNSSGIQQWVTRYNGPGNGDDIANAIALDSSGNLYVTGKSKGSGTNYDYATLKYNNAGTQQWVARYNGPENHSDIAYAIALDSSENVYVTGESYNYETYRDYATIKYNSSGIEQWVAKYNGPGNVYDKAYAIALDSSGNVYVTGKSASSSTSPYNFDYATIKYNSSGVEQWVSRYNGPGNGDDSANDLVLDGLGNVYVTGYSLGSGTYDDYATIKYNSSGVEEWVARYNGPANSGDGAYAIALDGSENVYVTGWSYGSGTGYDYTTIKYSQGTSISDCIWDLY